MIRLLCIYVGSFKIINKNILKETDPPKSNDFFLKKNQNIHTPQIESIARKFRKFSLILAQN